jgi:hypothetical protein
MHLGAPRFDKGRTSFGVAVADHPSMPYSSCADEAYARNLLAKVGRKERLLPFVRLVTVFAEKHGIDPETARKVLGAARHMDGFHGYPLIGWDDIRSPLEAAVVGTVAMPGLTGADLAAMSMEEGVEVLFGRIMPAIDAYRKL